MNKHFIIVIIASVVIVATLGFTIFSAFAANQIQFGGAEYEKFSYFELINNGKISLCNPSPFYVSLNEINVEMIYQGKNKGVLSLYGVILEPSSESTIQGKFTSDTFQEVQYLSMHYDGMFSGTTPIRIDPTELVILTKINTQVLGFFPVSVSNQYSGLEFWEMLSGKSGEYSC